MKAKLTRPDGTIIELEGDAPHVQAALMALSPAPLMPFAPLLPGIDAGGGVPPGMPMWPGGTYVKAVP